MASRDGLIRFRVCDDLKAVIKRAAKESDISMSEFVRRAVDDKMAGAVLGAYQWN